jgi:hypothetical protein
MGIGLLAPVPAVHITSAIETYRRAGRVAFATNAIDVFAKIDEEYGAGIPVIIQPTVRYGDPKGYARSSFGATYDRFVTADRSGRHPDPAVRPDSALNPQDPDTPVLGFWEIVELRQLPSRIAFSTLTAKGKKTPLPKTFILHGPILVTASFL